ncbi:hypothetical protein POG22_07300 [Geitlerinema sp. CS-897]|nr:hypothetical protein [Geitlerinema sp. CS-897]
MASCPGRPNEITFSESVPDNTFVTNSPLSRLSDWKRRSNGRSPPRKMQRVNRRLSQMKPKIRYA